MTVTKSSPRSRGTTSPAVRLGIDRKTDLIVSATLLSLGFIATVCVAVIVVNWSALMGDGLEWAKWMLLGVQGGLFVIAALICGWRWRSRKLAFVIALISGVAATGFFWIASFLLVASLPCPSFC